MMTRIDRYILGLFLASFIGGLLVFSTIFLAVDAMSMMVSNPDISTSVLFSYYMAYLPEVMRQIFPVACVIGTVLTLSTLNRANELVALFASGMSLVRIAAPVLITIAVFSIVFFFVNDRIQPLAARNKLSIYYSEIKKRPDQFSVVKTDRIWYRAHNKIFNIKTLNPDTAMAQNLTMYFFSDAWDLLQMLTAQQVDMNGTVWTLKDGSVTVFSTDSSFPLTSDFKVKKMEMGQELTDLTGSGQTSDMLSQGELSEFIKKNKAAGLDTLQYEVDYHSRWGFAAAGLVMALLGVPFSVGRARSGGTMMNLGIVLGLVFGYWIAYSSALNLGKHGQLPAIVAAWLPNLLAVLLGVTLLKRLKR